MREQPDDGLDDLDREPTGPGSLKPLETWVLAVWAIVGLVVGWLWHPISDRAGTPPQITWAQPLALLLVVAIVGGVAWTTYRSVHVRRERLEPGQGLNRLILGRACAYVGSLVGGAYLGYALSWFDHPSELAEQRMGRSLLCTAACALLVVVSLLLERACRVPKDDAES